MPEEAASSMSFPVAYSRSCDSVKDCSVQSGIFGTASEAFTAALFLIDGSLMNLYIFLHHVSRIRASSRRACVRGDDSTTGDIEFHHAKKAPDEYRSSGRVSQIEWRCSWLFRLVIPIKFYTSSFKTSTATSNTKIAVRV
jgi:hypothetical protein